MRLSFLEIFLLPFAALIFAFVVAAFARRLAGDGNARQASPPPRRLWSRLAVAFGIVIGVAILLGALGVFVAAPRVRVATETLSSRQSPSPMPSAAYQWDNAMSLERSLPRDPHTSMKTLKAYMAASVETALARVGEGARKTWIVAEERVPQELVSEIRRETKAQSPNSKSQAGDITDADAVVRVRWEEAPSSVSLPSWPQPMRQGTLVADITAPRGEESVRARLEEKPWLGATPAPYGRQDYVVVTSGEPTAATRDEALYRLNQSKAATVARLVESQVATLSSQWHARPEDVRSQVQANYTDAGTSFDDQVVMRIDRPFGAVWQAAGLVRVPTSNIARMAQAAQAVSYDRRAGWAKMIGGAAGMLLVLLVLYAIMNAITRGYFRPHLRTAVAIFLALAVVVMFLRMA